MQDCRQRIAVLGASGFLGSAMTQYLANEGHQVHACSRQQTDEWNDFSNVVLKVGDLRDPMALTEAVTGVDFVYHFASTTHPTRHYSDPLAECNDAFLPLLTLMEVATQAKVKKIVFPSSGGTVYADSPSARTEESPTDPRSPYAIIKLASEQMLKHAVRMGQFSVDIFRLGNPFGIGQRARPGQGVLPHWIQAIQTNQPIQIFGDGTDERDYIFVNDVCQLMATSLHRPEASEVFNLGTGRATSLNELLRTLQSVVDHEIHIEYRPSRPVDIRSISLDSRRLLKLIPGFEFIGLRQGIEATLKSCPK
ncbi:hypothetical protein CEE69_05170 [Rhodopirellula bahusiensis]|uniref:NAD-dependent epimerase/dehydratase domain-containing protein n=1 Tax=Rhodopirellula bahusiensis TaxID=2014065 RepID=A0A2G1WCG5_9BACT|nr:hypothetical protein CEE69_05170 [Rhodopirellula bahusiensis]